MKKFLFTMICALFPIFASAQEPYAVLSNDNTTLTFFYDNDKESKGGMGMDIVPFTSAEERGWNDHCESIGHVIFEGSFANYTPTSTSYWFDGFTNLTQIDGLENLKTNNVTDMSCMFNGCEKLGSLNLSGFITSNVTYMSVMFGGCSSLEELDLSTFNTSNVQSMDGMFRGCSGLTSLDVSSFNTDNVTEMSEMFAGCSNLTNLDFGDSNTSNVTTMWAMFSGCSKLGNLDLSNFITANVENMSAMFSGCSSLTNLDISNFNTENVISMANMFDGCSNLESLQMDSNNFSTENVTNMGSMFGGCLKLTTLDLSGFKTSNVSDFSHMFASCSGLTSLNVTGFDTSNATNMNSMFNGCTGLTYLDLSHFDTSNVTAMSSMFEGCSKLDSLNLSGLFNTSNATDLSYMFYGCSRLKNLDLSSFNTSTVKEMQSMFYHCNGLETILVGNDWSTVSIENGTDMFIGCTALVGGAGTTYDANNIDYNYAHIDRATSDPSDPGYLSGSDQAVPYAVLSVLNEVNGLKLTFYYDNQKAKRSGMTVGPSTSWGQRGWDEQSENIKSVVFDESFENCTTITSTSSWFYNFTNLTTITGLENLITDNVTDMSSMFLDCSSLTSLDVSHFNTSNVTNLYQLFAGCRSLTSLDVSNFDTSNATNLGSMFLGCLSLTELDVTGFDTSNAIYLYSMFGDCESLTTLNVTGFNTSKAISLESMFNGCSGLTSLDLSGFDTSNATGLGYMFYNCENLTSLDLSSFNTSNVTSMRGMFRKCSGLTSLDVSGFDTSNATIMEQMFFGCSSLTNLDLSNFNTSKVTAIGYMFYQCSGLETIHVGNGWSTESIEDGAEMFTDCTALVGGAGTTYDANNVDYHYAHIDKATSDPSDPGYFTGKIPYAVLSEGNTVLTFYCGAQATDNGMSVGPFTATEERGWYEQRGNIVKVEFDESFANCTSITSTSYWFDRLSNLAEINGLGFLKTNNVTEMVCMFHDCVSLTNLEVSGFKTSKVINYESMFNGCESLTNLDVNGFDTSNATDFHHMFANCFRLTSLDVTGFVTSKAKNMYSMFGGCYDLTSLDVSHFNTSNVTSMGEMFCRCESLTSLELGNFNTSNVTSMYAMFAHCFSLTNLDISNFDTSKVNDMSEMFSGCENLASLDVNGFDTSNTSSMDAMFSGCSGLTSLEVGNFKTEKVSDLNHLFANCSSLTSIDVSGFVTSNATDMRAMFKDCSGLTNLDLSGFDTSNTTDMSIMFAGCSGFTNLDLSGFNTSNVTNMTEMFKGCGSLTTISVGEGWSTEKITEPEGEGDDMFTECTALVGGAGTTYNANNVDYTYAHIDGGEMNPGYLTGPSYEPYAVLSEGNTVLTFYCGAQATDDGMSVGPFTTANEREWADQCENIVKVVFDESFADCTSITSTSWWFSGFTNLTEINGLGFLKTDNVTEMESMFSGCSGLTSLDVSGFDTSNATDLTSMFAGCSGLTSLDVSGFNTQNVTDMYAMFADCSSLTSLDVSGFNTQNVINMESMFYGCNYLTTIYVGSDWTTDNIYSGENMFSGCESLIGDAGTAYNENHVDYTYARIDLGATNRGYLSDNSPGNKPYAVPSEDSPVLTFYYDDQKAARGGRGVGPFYEDDESTYGGYHTTWGPGIESVVFDESFANCTTITSTRDWFYGCNHLTTITGLENLKTDNVTDMCFMFYGCEALTSLNVSGFNTQNVIGMVWMFRECSSLTSLDLSGFNTSKVIDMSGMFNGCSGLTSLDVSGFNTQNVTNMANMFGGCSGLTSLDVSGFDTSKATNMAFMFSYCPGLTSLDLSGFNTANVTLMTHMFMDCTSLNTIYVGEGWSTENISSEDAGIGMFNECFALVGGAGTQYSQEHVNVDYAHIDKGEMNPGYLTGPSYEPYAVLSDNNTVLIFYYDDQKEEREGMSVGPFTTDTREWKDYVTEITYVEFDPSFDDCTSITSTARWFDGCSNLTKISGIKYLHTENVTSMRRMFNGCSGLEKLDVSGFNTESVTDMGSMFNGCSALKALNVTGFNTESVTDMSSMFNSCSGLSILDLSNFITINAENMRNLFRGCSSLKTIYVGYEWITEPTMEGNNMFLNCTNIEGGAGTQYDGDHTNQAYAHVDGGTSDPGYLTGPNQPRPYAVLSEDNNGLTLTFYYDNKKDERGGMDVGPFDDGGKKNGSGWSEVNEEITTVVFDDSFANCTTLTSTAYWFYGCENLTTIKNFSNLKTDNVIDINSMFHDCHSLKSIDFSSLNLSKVTNMHQVFEDCRTLESVNFSGVNTENVTDMSDLFLNCHNLKTIDISSFNTKNVTNMKSMFLRCDVLTTIYVGEEWTTENVTESESMFKESPNLVGGRGTTYDANHVDIEYAHIDGGASDPGYLTDINGSGGASDETWAELKATIEYGTDVLARAKESSTVEAWMIEDLEMMLESGNQMYNIHEADEEEVRHMIEELNHIIHEVEEAMNVPASDEAWAELHEAVEAGEKLQIEAKDVSTVEPWALEELENMTAKGSEMYKVHTADEEEVRHMTEELRHIINEVEDMMRKQPEPQDEALFDGLTAYVNGKATLDDAFESVGGRTEAAKTIAAIVWNSDSALTANMLAGIDNPNLLVYVTEASKAPSGVQNVVINGIAEKIVLTDATGNNNFYCPQSFTAQSISYTRDFSQTTEIQVSRGWETITLPFPVQDITHETHGALAPFGSGSNAYPFWLRQLTSNGLTRATMIEANKPYLISMPNNIVYPAEYNQNGKVTFSSTRVTVPVTSAQSNSYNGITLYAAFQQVTKSSSIYALNVGEARGEYPEGSVFEQNYRDIRPFQAYTTHTNNINRYITVGSLGNADDNATGIEELRFKNFEDAEGTWYSLDGRRLDAKPTKKGIYVKDGRKIVIK